MLNVTGKYITVFQPEQKEGSNVLYANLSSTKKNVDKDDNITYENMSWKARFVGEAYKKHMAKPLKEQDKIDIVSGVITNEWVKEKKKAYVNVTVFDYTMSQLAT